MDQQWNPAQEADTFARVWQRVAPDPDASPIQCDGSSSAPPPSEPILPLGPNSAVWGDFLRTKIVLELTRWRTCQALSTPPNRDVLCPMAACALRRAKRMAAALFLLSDVWYLPRAKATPRSWNSPREGCRTLFRNAQQAALDYHTAAVRTSDPILKELFQALSQEATAEQQKLLRLLAR